MKILHVCGSFPPAYAYGGPPRSVHDLTSALADRGHEVTVFTTDAKDAESRIDPAEVKSRINGVDVHRFRNLSNRLAWWNIQVPPMMMSELFRSVSEYDVVHSHEFRTPPMVFAHHAATRAGVPHVHQPRGSLPRYERSTLKRSFDSVIGERIIQSLDALIASSRIESSNYPKVFPSIDLDTVSYVPNGISNEDFRDLPEAGSFRRSYDIPSDSPMILFLSRLHPRKGGDLLIEAVSRLSCDDIRLVFVGPDEGARSNWEAKAKRSGIEEKTTFVGPLYGTDKLEAYVDADVFVLPSKNTYESFGNVVIEAMACGTPVIVTNVCGVSDWLENDGCTTVPPEAQPLSESIATVLHNGSVDRSSLSEYAQQNFTWDAIAERTERIYDEVIV